MDYYKLAADLGKDFGDDFKYNTIDLLKFAGLQTVIDEDGLGAYRV